MQLAAKKPSFIPAQRNLSVEKQCTLNQYMVGRILLKGRSLIDYQINHNTGESGLDGTTLLPPPSTSTVDVQTPAITAMHNALISAPEGKAWLITTGALTNAALLFAVHPQLVDHIAGLSIMGGAVGGLFTNAPMGHGIDRINFEADVYRVLPTGLPCQSGPTSQQFASVLREHNLLPPASDAAEEDRLVELLDLARSDFGNWTRYAEFNIYIDPESAKSIFSTPALAAKTTLIPLDITHQVLANEDVLRRLRLLEGREDGYTPSRMRKLFLEILTFFAATYAEQLGMKDGPPLHDPLAVAAALSPSLFDDNGGERYDVYVITDGDDSLAEHTRNLHNVGQCGRTVLTPVEAGKGGVRVPRTLHIDAFWEMVNLSLDAAEARSSMG